MSQSSLHYDEDDDEEEVEEDEDDDASSRVPYERQGAWRDVVSQNGADGRETGLDELPLFTMHPAQHLMRLSLRIPVNDETIPCCNLCGYKRTMAEMRLNDRAMIDAAHDHFKFTAEHTRTEAEGLLKVAFGERDIVPCAACHQFSGECCAAQTTHRRSMHRPVNAMVVTGLTYHSQYFAGSPAVPPTKLRNFYRAVLDGELTLHVACKCEGGCDPAFRVCCRTAGRGVVPAFEHLCAPPPPRAMPDALRPAPAPERPPPPPPPLLYDASLALATALKYKVGALAGTVARRTSFTKRT